MKKTPGTRRLGLVVGLAVVLVAATPPPNTGQNGQLVTPTPVATRVTMKPTPTPTPHETHKPTPTPDPTPTLKVTPTPTPSPDRTVPPKLVLSDSIQFDGPQFCKLTSDVSDQDAPNAAGVPYENPGPMNCRITANHYGPTAGVATISVPGNPNETIIFKYSISGSTVTAGAVKEVEGNTSYAASITGTMHGVPGTPTFYGNIKVWEPSTAP